MATATAPKFADVKVGDVLKPLVLPPVSRHPARPLLRRLGRP